MHYVPTGKRKLMRERNMNTRTTSRAIEYLTERLYSEIDYAHELASKLKEEADLQRTTGIILAWSTTDYELKRTLRTVKTIRSTISRLRAEPF